MARRNIGQWCWEKAAYLSLTSTVSANFNNLSAGGKYAVYGQVEDAIVVDLSVGGPCTSIPFTSKPTRVFQVAVICEEANGDVIIAVLSSNGLELWRQAPNRPPMLGSLIALRDLTSPTTYGDAVELQGVAVVSGGFICVGNSSGTIIVCGGRSGSGNSPTGTGGAGGGSALTSLPMNARPQRFLAAHAAHPWVTVWDDHELANNTWQTGAENHNEGEGDFFQRIQAARQAYHEWMPIRTGLEGDQGVIYRAFQIGDLADLIMLDTRLVGRDEQLDYGKGIERAGSVEAFLKNDLYNPERQMLGKEQEAWLQQALQSSKARGATWQVLGQQVLMGKLNIPVIPPEEVAKLELSEFARPRFEQAQQMAPYGLPSNLDAWDGYPAARERLFAMLSAHATNPISLAGDTHNAWAFSLTNAQGEAVGVEWGTPGVSSPGLESYVPLPPGQMQALLKGASPELVACDTSQRGWTQVTLTPESATVQWRFVSSVVEPTYQVSAGEPLVAERDTRRLT